jgi:regulator of protease activity HflC (stomatin/prohibitin superfamily)
MNILLTLWPFLLIALVVFSGLFTVNQGTIAVITRFGKYAGIRRPGLRFKIPFIDQVFKRISYQNRSVELEFQAVTLDQANVYFKSMLLYSVQNESEDTIQKVAFKFISERDFMQALVRTIEGNIRAFVATKKQSEILGLRRDIVEFLKEHVDASL